MEVKATRHAVELSVISLELEQGLWMAIDQMPWKLFCPWRIGPIFGQQQKNEKLYQSESKMPTNFHIV